ncbi:MAG TPA: ethanolamine ammonia-lyase subunit EutC [Polyangiaceae bacterium]
MSAIERDPWTHLASLTTARIALGRSGGSLRTATQLALRLAHARARDAIHMPFDVTELQSQLSKAGIEHAQLTTQAGNRNEYLTDPGKGRRLSDIARHELLARRRTWGQRELVVVISDGLSALAAERQAAATIGVVLSQLEAQGVSSYPVLLVPFARVKLADDIGELLHAKLSLILLGERPGLSSPDSLGAYVTFGPNAARTDAERNCISNIRPDGVAPAAAGRRIAAILLGARRLELTGVGLKLDES